MATKKTSESEKGSAVRVLREFIFEGRRYVPDDVIEFSDPSAMVASGAVDPHPDAVACAVSSGATVRKHSPSEA